MKFFVAFFIALVASAVARSPAKVIPKILTRKPLKTTSSDTKVIGGEDAEPNEFPHQAALLIDNAYFCGGSLISTTAVLTAAHCVNGHLTVEVTLGEHDRLLNDGTEIIVTSTDFKAHEDYAPFLIRNDVGVIKLPEAVAISNVIKPANLGTRDISNELAIVSGWGKTSDTSGIARTLQKAELTVLSDAECTDAWGSSYVAEQMICTDAKNSGQGSCNGDSGGPLQQKDSTTGEYTVYGVVSFGSSAGCTANQSVFARVSFFEQWISAAAS